MNQKASACCSPRTMRELHQAVVGSAHLAGVSSGHDARRLGNMISLSGGKFWMGTNEPIGFLEDGEGPARQVEVVPFEIDATPVTNQDFSVFVDQTRYQTDAEKFGWSFVFWALIAEDRFDELVDDTVAEAPWWCKVNGAHWAAPEGPGSCVESRADHPVVHVSWNDARAYAAWAKKSLPTEAEWEYAARGGLEQKRYPWGNERDPDGRHMCNIWQGRFPMENTAEDGFIGTCPVDAFAPNGYGLLSVVGNTWEWCADDFSTPLHLSAHAPVTAESGKVMKGGSFLCHDSYCNRYRIAARTQNAPDSSSSNVGFRCVRHSHS